MWQNKWLETKWAPSKVCCSHAFFIRLNIRLCIDFTSPTKSTPFWPVIVFFTISFTQHSFIQITNSILLYDSNPLRSYRKFFELVFAYNLFSLFLFNFWHILHSDFISISLYSIHSLASCSPISIKLNYQIFRSLEKILFEFV